MSQTNELTPYFCWHVHDIGSEPLVGFHLHSSRYFDGNLINGVCLLVLLIDTGVFGTTENDHE